MQKKENLKDGKVIDSCRGFFTVEHEDGTTSKCNISGRMRKNNIHVIVGDYVGVEYKYDSAIIVQRYLKK